MRSEAMPELPTIGEFVPGYEISSRYGLGAPKDTPTEVIDKLNKEINEILADPNAKARLADLGGTALGKYIAEETEKWGEVIQSLNIKAD
jgi:tripartite-type tricarboxylate transporter receptor subunit TctC